MSYTAIDDCGRQVCLRKPHRCEWCGEMMIVGEKAVVRVYKFDGDFNYNRMHPECWDALNRAFKNDELRNGEFEGSCMPRGLTEYEEEKMNEEMT